MFPFGDDQETSTKTALDRVKKQMVTFESAIILRRASDGAPGFLESGLCSADVLVAELAEGLLGIREDILAGFPVVSALHKHVVSLKQIKLYLSSDKRYPFPHGDVGVAYVSNVKTVLNR